MQQKILKKVEISIWGVLEKSITSENNEIVYVSEEHFS